MVRGEQFKESRLLLACDQWVGSASYLDTEYLLAVKPTR